MTHILLHMTHTVIFLYIFSVSVIRFLFIYVSVAIAARKLEMIRFLCKVHSAWLIRVGQVGKQFSSYRNHY